MSDYQAVYKNSYALAIGINTYSDPRFATLGQAEADAQAFADLLKGPPFNFKVTTLLGSQATKDAIEMALYRLRASDPDDRILVYFAGHGYTLVDEFKQETGYLAAADTVPEQDFTALELEEVTSLTRHAKAKHIAFLFDACYSGQALGLTRAPAISSDKFLERRAFQVVSAGAGDQTVSDAHSMTGLLVEGLRVGIADDDGLVTLSEIALYLQKTIAADSGKTQIPQFGHLRGSQGGDFVFYQDAKLRLPNDLYSALASTRDSIRLGAAEALLQIAQGDDPNLAKLARERLDALIQDDPSEKVRAAVRRLLSTPEDVPTAIRTSPVPPEPSAPRRRKPSKTGPFGLPMPVWLGGIGAVAVVGIFAVVCLISVLSPGKVNPTPTPDILASEEVIATEGSIDATIEATAPIDEQAAIRADITKVLDRAYELKVSTLRDVNTEGLEDAYTGEALAHRIKAVNISKTERCNWEVKLDEEDQLKFEAIGEDSARVLVLRVETRYRYCSGKKDDKNSRERDRYATTFFLVLQDGRWLVADSEVADLIDH